MIAAGLVLEGRAPDPARPRGPGRAPHGGPERRHPEQSLLRCPGGSPRHGHAAPRNGGESEPDAPLPPNAVTGQAQVIDTATLKVGGKVVHLFGVDWVRGGQAEELARYIGKPAGDLPAAPAARP